VPWWFVDISTTADGFTVSIRSLGDPLEDFGSSSPGSKVKPENPEILTTFGTNQHGDINQGNPRIMVFNQPIFWNVSGI
jgi:hypothetical protein